MSHRGGRGGGGGGRGGRGRGRGGGRGGGATEAGSSSSAAAEVEALSAEVERSLAVEVKAPPVSTKGLRFPARPGPGTVGTPCLVKANHFLVKLREKDLHHYDVAVTPEVISRGVNRAILNQLIKDYGQKHLGNLLPAYDGRKSLYTAGPLPFTSKEFTVKLVNEDGQSAKRERTFKVAIKFAARADLHHLRQFLSGQQMDSAHDTIQVLDVVLRESPSKSCIVVGRSFFSERYGPRNAVGEGLECWRGYYQSLRPTQMGLSLNIDVSVTSFYEPIGIVQYTLQFLNIRDPLRPLADNDRVKLKKALRGVKVEVTHMKERRRYKISGLTPQPTNQLRFPVDDKGTVMSVVQYFQEKYGIRLRHVTWPSLQAGNDARPVFLPMEVCQIVGGQRYTKKLNERQVTALLTAACQRPSDRERNIKQIVDENGYQNDKFAKEFGINVDGRLTCIEDARVLPPPVLKYHDTGREVKIQPHVGQWNMINTRMVNGGRIDHWACLNFSTRCGPDDAFHFFKELVGMCTSKGMAFNPNPLLPMRTARSEQIEHTLVEVQRQSEAKFATMGVKGRLQLLIIILPDFSGKYGTIKRVCETELGLVSQCCQPKHALKVNRQYLENVALKINVKAGGSNTVLFDALMRKIPLVSDAPTIIFGADVTHPSPGEDSGPSIAAVVASMDWPMVTKYRGLVSAQANRMEIIQDLFKVVQDPQKGTVNSGMIRELLIAFRRSTSHKPHRIIFYRDGVSEGQFSQVLLHELDAIRKACASLEEGYLPPVTFVVVQKRHHTRLFPGDHRNRNLTDRSGNILPGTVVDTKICHPFEFDFYLCSHSGIKGTSRPTHYHVLWDENRFSSDAMQTLTNNLCYTYARCTRSVSIVPPAYYAHLAAFRARYYIEGDYSDSGSGTGSSRGRAAEARALPQIKENVKDVMFYC
ncbi:hypothetical protein Scep_015387 [Stephania cephalantha]|uniref:Protein argonaute 5 n=1 Tax=Stephania cephalantha TaxID=152367 RepID=A0AAP0J5K9_9MAGN